MFLFGVQKKKKEDGRSLRESQSQSKHTGFKRSKTSMCIEGIDLAFGAALNKRSNVSRSAPHFTSLFAPKPTRLLFRPIESVRAVLDALPRSGGQQHSSFLRSSGEAQKMSFA